MTQQAATAYYVTTLDRIGLAILTGGLLTGLVAMLLVVGGGERSFATLLLAWIVGATLAMLGIVAVFAPAWLVLHRRGWRGPGAAAATGGLLALVLVTLGQIAKTGGGGYRLASALATSMLIALIVAAIAAAMQRVAYRRLL